MEEEKTNFVRSGATTMIVKKLTNEIITETVEVYLKLEDDGYWLKLCQLSDNIDISIFNKLDSQQRKLDNLIYGKLFNYSFQKYSNFSLEAITFFETMLFLTILALFTYCVLTFGLLDFFSVFIQTRLEFNCSRKIFLEQLNCAFSAKKFVCGQIYFVVCLDLGNKNMDWFFLI